MRTIIRGAWALRLMHMDTRTEALARALVRAASCGRWKRAHTLGEAYKRAMRVEWARAAREAREVA